MWLQERDNFRPADATLSIALNCHCLGLFALFSLPLVADDKAAVFALKLPPKAPSTSFAQVCTFPKTHEKSATYRS